jgi:hypothetical protein
VRVTADVLVLDVDLKAARWCAELPGYPVVKASRHRWSFSIATRGAPTSFCRPV